MGFFTITFSRIILGGAFLFAGALLVTCMTEAVRGILKPEKEE